ncbi:hypothetical protein ACFWXO_05435 [Kitasatospora sp. NPDC059088]|uniref:hypothetical protein n=1 Tax=Kitasatospora sp. NPDC059088 TaxID=3346722 RepID=UPI0036A2DC17
MTAFYRRRRPRRRLRHDHAHRGPSPPVTGDTELHRHYQNQNEPQQPHVELGLADGVLLASYEAQVGTAVPGSVRYGIELRWDIPPLTAEGANELLEQIRPAAQRLLDSSEVHYVDWNQTGRLVTDDARRAYDEIEALCRAAGDDPAGVLEVWTTDSIGAFCSAEKAGVTAGTTDDQLLEVGARLTAEFRESMGSGPLVIDGLNAYLRDLRDTLARTPDED